ncbi:MAG: integrin alpha [Longimonas sp.]|uniref:integrin alpha n=1 Tax=Longimonas sp. TaxID=2039626 RepID=UPI0039758B79
MTLLLRSPLFVFLVIGLLASAPVPEAQGQEPSLEINPPTLQEDTSLAGATVETLGDDTSDLLVGVPGLSSDGEAVTAGRVYRYDSASGELVDSLTAPEEPEAGFGASLTPLGDVDDDGTTDFAVGSLSSAEDVDAAAPPVLVSGASFDPIRTLDPGDTPGAAASLDAGTAESPELLAVGRPGEVLLFSLPSGELERRLTSPADTPEPFFGHEVSVIDDVNDDGTPDVLVAAPIEPEPWSDDLKPPEIQSELDDLDALGRAYVFDGATGEVLHSFTHEDVPDESQNPDYWAFGSSVAQVPDVDNDGVDDLAIGMPHFATGMDPDGEVPIFSGASGAHLHTLEQEEEIDPDEPGVKSHRTFGQGIAPAGDVNGDETTDLLVTSDDGKVFVLDGVTGEQLAGLKADFSSRLRVHTSVKDTGPRPMVSASLSALHGDDSDRSRLVLGGEDVRIYNSADLDIPERSPEEADQIREMNRASSEELASWMPDSLGGHTDPFTVPDDEEPKVASIYGNMRDDDPDIIAVDISYSERMQNRRLDSLDSKGEDIRVREFEGHELHEGNIQYRGHEAVVVALFPGDYALSLFGTVTEDDDPAERREELRALLEALYTERLTERMEAYPPETP